MPENRPKTGNSGSFRPGKSGNPGGRPKLSPRALEVRTAFRAGSLRAVERLIELVDSDDPGVALKAANVILDRAWGTPGSESDVRQTDMARIEAANARESDSSPEWESFMSSDKPPPDVD